ncbi:MAG: hypothetical protein R2729_21645 [Bryobacteraceae bacterium]
MHRLFDTLERLSPESRLGRSRGQTSRLAFVSFATLVLLQAPSAQAQIGIIGTTGLPRLPSVYPGHITTLLILGIEAPPTPAYASTFPLPTELSGISVLARTGQKEQKAPILSVLQCCVGRPMGAAITIQWPDIFDTLSGQEVAVIMNGRPVASEEVVFAGSTRILSGSCAGQPRAVYALPEEPSCDRNARPLVTHADGGLVRAGNPARPGETLIVYAVGVTSVDGEVPIGIPSPAPPIRVNFVRASLDYAYDGGRNPETENFQSADYAGLTPGGVGVTQIHVKVPELPDSLLPCSEDPRRPVTSNLTISILTDVFTNGGGRDRIGICVDPGPVEGKQNPIPTRRHASERPRFDPSRFPLQ